MHPTLADRFHQMHIDSFAVLPFADCRVQAPQKLPQDFAVQSVIFFLVPYFTGDIPGRNVSLYALAGDYHGFLRDFFADMLPLCAEVFPTGHFRGYADNSPFDERLCCAAAGLGVLGDNGLLISPQYGTYQFLAEIVTDIPPHQLASPEEYAPRQITGCEHCGACQRACPMLHNDFGIDECLSAVTQTKRFPDAQSEENALAYMYAYGTLWGCDLCQTACPHNRFAAHTPIPFFYRDRIAVLTPQILGAMDKETFRSRAYSWRGRACITRNAEYFAARKAIET